MLEAIKAAPSDRVLVLIAAFKADKEPKSENLMVGVHHDETGKRAVLSRISHRCAVVGGSVKAVGDDGDVTRRWRNDRAGVLLAMCQRCGGWG